MDNDIWDFAIKAVKVIAAGIIVAGMSAAFFAGYLFFQWLNGLPAR